MATTDERVRLRLGTAFIEHRDDLWPGGEPAATRNGSERMSTTSWPCWNRCLAATATCAACRTGCTGCCPWLLDELDRGEALDG